MNISLIPLNDIQTADDSKKCGYSVYLDNKIQGNIWLYDNPYHTCNRYVKIELNPLKNEIIAYVCGKDLFKFKEFAQGLITEILVKYKTICFESDDCDPTAMFLKSLFKTRNEASLDTYVLK